jgi:hypothetical protein
LFAEMVRVKGSKVIKRVNRLAPNME